jgi:predicted nuclease of predicted toxin-antitoxin system
MVRLYTNENFPFRVASLLRDFGYDVLTVQEAGNAGQGISDEAVLAFAVEQERAVITINRRDFIRLHHHSATHAGIIVCTQDPDLDGQAQRIHQAISARETLTGQLIRINRPPR